MLSLFTILRKRLYSAGLKPGEVFLTFDDGPNLVDNVTVSLLNVLHRHDVKAGFCLVGKLIDSHPQVVRRMYHSGHLLINHTYRHRHPMRQSYRVLDDEVAACDAALGRALGIPGYRSHYFRAPYGIVTPAVRRVTRRRKMQQVLLTHYGWDTRVGPGHCEPVVDLMLSSAREKRGGLFVFHDGSLVPSLMPETTWAESPENRVWVPEAVDRIITELKAEGLRFVIPQASHQAPMETRNAAKRAA